MKILHLNAAMLVAAATFCSVNANATSNEQEAETSHSYYNCANAYGCKLVKEVEQTSEYTKTEYPIVLAHGMAGFTRIFGLVEYFNGIPQALMEGGSTVYATKVSSFDDTEVRGEQLLRQVKTITALSGKPKVNLMGHSHGGIDIRYVAGVAPQYIASVTAVASPEQGSKMADWTLNEFKEISEADGVPAGQVNTASKAVLGIMNFLGKFMDFGSGISGADQHKQDSLAALNSLSSEYALKFNAKFPAAMPTEYCGQPQGSHVVNGIPYYSFSGIGTITSVIDPSDYFLALTAKSFDKADLNDGLVSKCSSRLGYVIRDDYHMNHLDSVNLFFGLVAKDEVDPISVYRTQVNRLKAVEGL